MAIFFDLDGTLTDPKEGITGSVQYALQKMGQPVPTKNELTWCIGPPLLQNFEKLVGVAQAQQGVDLYRERFGEIGLFENEPYPGIHELLAKLKTRPVKLYVASSKAQVYVERIVERFELSTYFDDIFGAELNGTRADKTELLTFALSETNSVGEQCTMIGDRSHDMIGAKNNRMRSIGVLYGYGSRDELLQAGADSIAQDLADLAELLFNSANPP